MADVQDRQEFFINAANKDDDEELLDELDELEAELAQEDFDDMEVASGNLIGAKSEEQPIQNKAKPNKQQDEADMLAQMMAWVAID